MGIAQALYDFLDQNLMLYVTRQGIEISAEREDLITLAADWPNHEEGGDYSLELVYENETLEGFIQTFNIKTVDDIEEITIQMMIDLYVKGVVQVLCAFDTADYYYALIFRRRDSHTTEAKDARDQIYIIAYPVETPEQFIEYTRLHVLNTDFDT
jgi:hypothetical protein